MSGSSRSKRPTAAKVAEKNRDDQGAKGALNDLFPAKKNKLVPARAPITGSASERYGKRRQANSTISGVTEVTEPQAQRHAERPARGEGPKLDTIRVQETIVTPRGPKPNVTSASKIKEDISQSDSRSTRTYALAFLLLLFIALGVNHYFKAPHRSVAIGEEGPPGMSAEALRERVAFHRDEVGHKLNRQRLDVQFQNQLSAPPLPEHINKVNGPDMMAGLPLVEEPVQNGNLRDRLEPADPTYADTSIEYQLKEQQVINAEVDEAQKQYIKQFIANAEKAGYRVKVDKYGNVKVVGRIPAAAKSDGGPSLPGSVH